MTRPLCFLIGAGWAGSAVGQYYRALGRELAARGHRVLFLVDGRRTHLAEPATNPAIHVWPSARPTRPADFRFAHRLIARHRPDGIIAAFGAVNTLILTAWLNRVPVRVAWYTTVSQNADLEPGLSGWQLAWLRRRKQWVYTTSSHVAAVSDAAADDLGRVFGVPPAKRAVWRRLLADPVPGLAAEPRASQRIVCAGRLISIKGQDILIRALPALAQRFPDVQLELLGDGAQAETYRQLAAELGVADRVCFAGQVTHGRVLERMAAAAVVVVPSRAEALGAVNIEALAVSTPVVAANVGGIGEVVRDGIDGYLVPPDDVAALSERVGRLLADPAQRAAFGDNARRGFLERFELDAGIARHAQWYEELVAAPGAATTLE